MTLKNNKTNNTKQMILVRVLKLSLSSLYANNSWVVLLDVSKCFVNVILVDIPVTVVGVERTRMANMETIKKIILLA